MSWRAFPGFVSFGLACLLALAGCSTLTVAVQKPAAASMSGLRTVVLELVTSERIVLGPIIDAGIYSAAVNVVRADLGKIDVRKCAELDDAVEAACREKLGCETMRVKNPFSRTAPPFGCWEAPSESATRKLRELCAANSADLALVYTFRVVTTDAGWLGTSGSSRGQALFYLFDPRGNLVARGFLQTESKDSGPQDLAAYARLYTDTRDLVPTLFLKMSQKGESP